MAIAQPPKLVVFISLDQFPYDYIERFRPYFGKHGFNYLLENGANFTNARYEYAYLKTGPGHATLLTGAYGHLHGITANHWYDRSQKKVVNCVGDESVIPLGSESAKCSPRNLELTTMGDALRLKSGNQAKVIGISNKDRVAILMAGKTGTAYWIADSVVASSSYYMSVLPAYITAFNQSGVFQQYFRQEWTETKPDAAVNMCDVDDAWYESPSSGLGKTFPHRTVGNDYGEITPSYYGALDESPFGAELLLKLGEKIIVAESLGTRGTTDMLCLGISATDIVGHSFGPNSHEVFDLVLRVDMQLEIFFSFLQSTLGLDNCLFALSSDHGIAPIPEYLKKISPATDAGRVTSSQITSIANKILTNHFSTSQSTSRWVEKVVDSDIYLNREYIDSMHFSMDSIMHVLRDSVRATHPFTAAYSRDEIVHGEGLNTFGQKVGRSYFAPRSGDVMVILKPYYIAASLGTTHGQPYDYDTHVPLIIEGKGIVPGTYTSIVSPADIAATLCTLLKLDFPKNREGKVLREALR